MPNLPRNPSKIGPLGQADAQEAKNRIGDVVTAGDTVQIDVGPANTLGPAAQEFQGQQSGLAEQVTSADSFSVIVGGDDLGPGANEVQGQKSGLLDRVTCGDSVSIFTLLTGVLGDPAPDFQGSPSGLDDQTTTGDSALILVETLHPNVIGSPAQEVQGQKSGLFDSCPQGDTFKIVDATQKWLNVAYVPADGTPRYWLSSDAADPTGTQYTGSPAFATLVAYKVVGRVRSEETQTSLWLNRVRDGVGKTAYWKTEGPDPVRFENTNTGPSAAQITTSAYSALSPIQ
jgi:hypothetical protein